MLVQHGMPGTGSIAALPPATLGVRLPGVRLIGVSRPGYEETTPAEPGFATVVEDALAVADALGAERFAVLGLSGGGPFAAAIAAAAPGRVTALGIAAGFGPWEIADPPESDAALIDQARSGDLAGAQEGFRQQCAAMLDPLLALPDDELAATIYPPGADAAFRRWGVADTRAALRDYEGLVRDNLTLGLPWDWPVEKITSRTFLWYGDADELVPVSHGQWWAEQVPQARLTVRAGEGHGPACFGHWREMLGALVQAGAAG